MIGSCTPLVARTRSGWSAMTASRLMLLGVIPPIEAMRPRLGRVIVERRPADHLAAGTDGEEDLGVGRRERHDALGKPGHGTLRPRLSTTSTGQVSEVPDFCSIGAVTGVGGGCSRGSRPHADSIAAADNEQERKRTVAVAGIHWLTSRSSESSGRGTTAVADARALQSTAMPATSK